MAPITFCDHCGRTGVTLGVYYPGRDMTKPPIRLCQTYQGTPIEPNCYHLVTERGETLGIRRESAILSTDRQSPRNEAVAIRFQDGAEGSVILAETQRPEGQQAPPPPRMSYVQGEHPLIGQRVPMDPPDHETSPAITKAEEGKGIINPHGADQRPLVNPASPEGQAIADAAAQVAAANIQLPGGLGPIGARERGAVEGSVPGRYDRGPVGDRSADEFPVPPQPQAISPDDMVRTDGPAPGPTVNTAGLVVTPDTGADPVGKTPAQVAAEAQAKADAADAKKAPAKKAPAKATKKAAPKAQDSALAPEKPTDVTSPLADVPDAEKPQAATEVARQQEAEAGK